MPTPDDSLSKQPGSQGALPHVVSLPILAGAEMVKFPAIWRLDTIAGYARHERDLSVEAHERYFARKFSTNEELYTLGRELGVEVRRRQLSPAEVARTFGNLGVLRIHTSEFFTVAAPFLSNRCNELHLTHLAKMFWGAGVNRYRDDKLFFIAADRVREILRNQDWKDENIGHLVKILNGIGGVPEIRGRDEANERLRTFARELLEYLRDRMTLLSAKELSVAVFAGTAFQLQFPTTDLLANGFARSVESFKDVELMQMRTAAILSDHPIPPQFEAEMEKIMQGRATRSSKLSETEGRVAESLRRIFSERKDVALFSQYYIEGSHVDYMLVRIGDHGRLIPEIANEVNGKHHYVNFNPRQGLSGPDLLQQRLLERHGIRVVHFANAWVNRNLQEGTLETRLRSALSSWIEGRKGRGNAKSLLVHPPILKRTNPTAQT